MKHFLSLLLIVVFSANAGHLFAAPVPVRVFSSNFSVGGDASCSEPVCPSYFEAHYSNTDPTPLSGAIVDSPYAPWTVASSTAGFFSVYAGAFLADSAHAYAAAAWTFSPLSSMNSLEIYFGNSGGSYAEAVVKLTDLTDMSEIYSLSKEDYWEMLDILSDQPAHRIEHSFRTDHIYKLDFGVYSSASYDAAEASIWTNDLIAAVPEPATVLLLGLGLLGLAWSSRIKYKNHH